MDANKTVTANFEALPTFALTLAANPAEAVSALTKTPDLPAYLAGAKVTVAATAADDTWAFHGWTDGATTVSTNASFEYTMPAAAATLTANYKKIVEGQYVVTVVADPVAGGTVTKSPDQATYPNDTVVTLAAAANDGFTFAGWYDGETQVSTEASYAYTVAGANKTFTAKFAAVPVYTLTVTADPTDKGTVALDPAGGSYEAGTVVTLTATPATDCQFDGWYDGATLLSTASPYQYTMPAENKALTAKFSDVIPGQYTVTVSADPIAGGTVTKSPDAASYANDTVVTLTAVPNTGFAFTGWFDGETQVSTEASYAYTVAGANKAFTAKFTALPTYALTLTASDGGTAAKSPDQAAYLEGAQVTLTATAASGYEFDGFYDGATLLSASTPYVYTMPAEAKTIPAQFSTPGPATPAGVTAVGNTYMVLVSWEPVTSATYVVTRTSGTLETSWATVATEFADDTAVPGVTYAYTVKAVDAQQVESAPSAAASAGVTAEAVAAANYKVTAKGYTLTRDASDNLTFTGSAAGTIKIALLKKMPANASDNPAKGLYYLTNLGLVPTLTINGDVKTLAFDVPVYSLEASGLVKSVSAKSVTFLSAGSFEKVTIAATKDSSAGLYARTFIETAGTSQAPMLIKVTGAVVEEVGSTGATAQPVKLLNVASKVYKDAAKAKRTSLGAIGSLPRVAAELANTAAPASEATPSSIQGRELKAIVVSGGPLVADEVVGAIDKVMVTGGNLRAGLIQSSKDLVLVQAKAKKVAGVEVGGALGTAGNPTALLIQAQPNAKKVAIGKVYGQTALSGYFYAGYDAATGDPTLTGGINILQTKTGTIQGAAFLDPTLVSKMKLLPKGQTIPTNPGM
jgi:uncharacterized repeat protein (TIGR02543 family)